MAFAQGAPRRPDPKSGPRATFRQLLPYLAEHKGMLAVAAALSLIAAATSLAQPLLVQQVIEQVGAGQPLGWLVWAIVGLVVLGALVTSLQHYLLQRTGEAVVLSSRRHLVSRLLRLPISEFDTRRTGDLVSRVGSDTTLLRAVLTQGLAESLGGSVTFFGAIIAMAILDPVLLGLTLLVIMVALVTVATLGRKIRAASRRAQEQVGALSASVERGISAVRTVRASNATEREIGTISAQAEGAYRAGLDVAKVSAFVMPISGIAMQIAFLVVLGVGGYRVAIGATTISALVAFFMFLFLIMMPLGQVFGAISAVNQALGALGRIQEIVQIPSEQETDAAVAATAAVPGSAEFAVEFVDVAFEYPESAHRTEQEKIIADALGEAAPEHDRVVLRGVTFQARRGERTALVGPSGAGKSTILALIERFYDPTSGVVRVNGEDVRALDRTELRSRLGYVEQDAPVLAGSIRDNLLLAAPDATDADCVRVLEQVNLGEVLSRDPRGLDAEVGENGVMLSGGERQRLAIARTLLSAPPILLLDESTSSLDGVNEQRLKDAIDAVAADRSMIVIAHRLATVVDADRIVVLEDGQVVGVGTHEELLESTPLYRDLAQRQLLA